MARIHNRAERMVSRRKFIRTGLIFVPTAYAHGQLVTQPCRRKAFASSSISAEPELSDWVSRVQTQGSDVTGSGVQTAVGAFIVSLKTDSIWTKIKRCNIYAGDGLDALEAPLIVDAGGGGATDILSGFVGGDYTEATGLTGGNAKYIDPNSSLRFLSNGIDDCHMSCYCRTGSNAATYTMGGFKTLGTTNYYLAVSHTGVSYAHIGDAGFASGADSLGVGFYIANRGSSTLVTLYKNGSSLFTNATPGGTEVDGNVLVVHAYNSGAGVGAFSARTLSFYSCGTSLTDTDAANFYTAVQALQTSLGRQV